MTQISAQQRFASVRARLEELGLLDGDALVMAAPGAVFNAAECRILPIALGAAWTKLTPV